MLNTSEETAEPVFMHLPNYLEVEMYPAKIAPHHTGVAVLSLDSKKLHDLGLNQTDIYLGFAPGDTVADDKLITVSSVLLPAFQNLTAKEIAEYYDERIADRFREMMLIINFGNEQSFRKQ